MPLRIALVSMVLLLPGNLWAQSALGPISQLLKRSDTHPEAIKKSKWKSLTPGIPDLEDPKTLTVEQLERLSELDIPGHIKLRDLMREMEQRVTRPRRPKQAL